MLMKWPLSCFSDFLPASKVVVPLAVLITVYGFSNAEPTLNLLAVGIIGLLGWCVFWVARLLIWLWMMSNGKPLAVLRRPWLAWLTEPICIGLMVLLVYTGLPLYLRFALSQPSLQKFVDQRLGEMATKGPQMSHLIGGKPETCGLFTIYNWGTGFDEGGKPMILMITARQTRTDAAGFGFTHSGGKPNELPWGGPHYFDHIWGPWWRLHLDV